MSGGVNVSPPVRYNTCSQVVYRLQNSHKTPKYELAMCEASKTWTLARRERHVRGMSRFPSLTDERKINKNNKNALFCSLRWFSSFLCRSTFLRTSCFVISH